MASSVPLPIADFDDIPQAARERLQQIGASEVVIGILSSQASTNTGGLLRAACETAGTLGLRTPPVVVQSVETEDSSDVVRVLSCSLVPQQATGDRIQSMSGGYRTLFAISRALGARACAAIASEESTITPLWISRLIQPVLELDYDLVTPCYSHRRLDGLLNKSIVAPLLRALYGKRIQHPLGPDLGFSSRLLGRLTGGPDLVSLATDALRGSEVCQAHVGVRLYPPADWTNVSSVLTPILAPLFRDVEKNAAVWQGVRGSQPVETFGESEPVSEGSADLDVTRMVESFQLGYRSLQEIWGIVLPPTTLLELSRLARVPIDRFRMTDELWARVVYDFALGYHLRELSPDHLVRAITPLYLAWVASYALQCDSQTVAEQRLEQLAMAYESTKPYFVSRWRWPDRFNP